MGAKTIALRLFAKEQEIVNKMKEDGYPVQETIRSFIREFGLREYPKERLYALNRKEELELKKTEVKEKKLTDEEYAVQKLGAVVIGPWIYLMNEAGNTVDYKLSEAKKLKPDSDIVFYHNLIMQEKEFSPPGQQYKWDVATLQGFKNEFMALMERFRAKV